MKTKEFLVALVSPAVNPGGTGGTRKYIRQTMVDGVLKNEILAEDFVSVANDATDTEMAEAIAQSDGRLSEQLAKHNLKMSDFA